MGVENNLKRPGQCPDQARWDRKVLEGDSELRAAPAAGRLLTSGEEAAGSSVRTASRPGCKESLARTLM